MPNYFVNSANQPINLNLSIRLAAKLFRRLLERKIVSQQLSTLYCGFWNIWKKISSRRRKRFIILGERDTQLLNYKRGRSEWYRHNMNILMQHKRLIALSEVNYSVEDTVEAVLISNIDGSGFYKMFCHWNYNYTVDVW